MIPTVESFSESESRRRQQIKLTDLVSVMKSIDQLQKKTMDVLQMKSTKLFPMKKGKSMIKLL